MSDKGNARILVVEDEMLVRELAAEDLSDAGYDVVSAGSGDEAMALLEMDRRFDLLFTDIRMPGELDGIELARRTLALLPDVAVIYATGYDDPSIDLSARERCIRKPYRFEDVLALLTSLGLASG